MFSRGNMKRTLATVVAGVLIGGGVTMVSPAGAEVSQFAATNWNKIWKKKLQKRADKRYYTKAASDAKYSTKTETRSLLGNYYTKAQADAALGGYYTKAQTYTRRPSRMRRTHRRPRPTPRPRSPGPRLLQGRVRREVCAGPAAQPGHLHAVRQRARRWLCGC